MLTISAIKRLMTDRNSITKRTEVTGIHVRGMKYMFSAG
jgi:hypothetical protein